jgi:hypothetical protein
VLFRCRLKFDACDQFHTRQYNTYRCFYQIGKGEECPRRSLASYPPPR